MNQNKLWPKTKEEFLTYLDSELNKEHDYNTAPEAAANIAIAGFNLTSSLLGLTGFQANWGELRFIQMSRNYEHFIILNLEEALYPQYNLRNRLEEFLTSSSSKEFLKKKALEKLEKYKDYTHPDVYAHWKKLAQYVTLPEQTTN